MTKITHAKTPFIRNSNFWKRYVREWVCVFLLLAFWAWYVSDSKNLQLANNYLYDRVVSLQRHAPDKRIVIVSVDDYSLKKIGRWPWSRDVHTQLFEKLSQAQPLAVMFDFLLTEESADDSVLWESITKIPNVVLPILLSPQGDSTHTSTLLSTQFSSHSKLGHIFVRPDDDGILRQVDLSLTDDEGRLWPLATQLMMGKTSIEIGLLRVPFDVPKGSYPIVSYAKVLNGDIPLTFFKDKYVFVGVTGSGMGEQYTTPISGASGLVSEIEVHANILDSLLSGRRIEVVENPRWVTLSWILPLLLLMVGFFWTVEQYHALLFMALELIYGVLVLTLFFYKQIWLPPILTIVLLALAYLLWSWRRLLIVLGYVRAGLSEAQSQNDVLSHLSQSKSEHWFLPRSIEEGMLQTQHLYRFTRDSLNFMPTALLLVSSNGQIVLANKHAHELFKINNNSTQSLLMQIDPNWQEPQAVDGHWLNALKGMELSGDDGSVFVLYVSNITFDSDLSKQPSDESLNRIWLIHFLELSEERLAQRQRNELMEFLSHDLRSPQVGILSLLELQKNQDTRLSESELSKKITIRVEHTLNWARDIVRLTNARAKQYQLEEINLDHVLKDSLERLDPHASTKEISLNFPEASQTKASEIWLRADGELLVRAFVNLISNAIRYSPINSPVEIDVQSDTSQVIVRIIDRGIGMDAKKVAQLNNGKETLLSLSNLPNPDAAQSMGIGFTMARAVIQRHGGTLSLTSKMGHGTTVTIHLPLA